MAEHLSLTIGLLAPSGNFTLSINNDIQQVSNASSLQISCVSLTLLYPDATEEFVNVSVSVKDANGYSGSLLTPIVVRNTYTSSEYKFDSSTANASYIIMTDGLGWYRAIKGSDGSVESTSTTADKLINDTLANGGVIAFQPNAVFPVSSTVLCIPSNTIIEGNGATIRQTAFNSFGAIFFTGSTMNNSHWGTCSETSNITVLDLTFKADYDFIPSNCISILGSSEVYIYRLHSYGMNKCVESHGRAQNIFVYDCSDNNNPSVNSAAFYTSAIHGTSEELINIHFINCTVNNSAGSGIILESNGGSIESCIVNNADLYGIEIRGKDTFARGCSVNKTSQHGFVATYQSSVENSYNLGFSDCFSTNSGYAGIYCENVSTISVYNCHISNVGSGYQALRLNNALHVTISNCQTIDDRTPQLMNYDVYCYGATDYVLLIGNNFVLGKNATMLPITNYTFSGNMGLDDAYAS